MPGEPLWWKTALTLADTITHGRPPLLGGYHHSPYDYLGDHPDTASLFDTFMTARTQRLATALAAILAAHPHLTGVLLERGNVTTRARDFLAGHHLDKPLPSDRHVHRRNPRRLRPVRGELRHPTLQLARRSTLPGRAG